MKALNQVNFNDTLLLDTQIEEYDLKAYMLNGKKHNIKGFCTRCEQAGYNTCPTDSKYSLQNISHGASTTDILQATGTGHIPQNWYKEAILFLMEGPSNGNFYQEFEYNGVKKKPTSEWYWIHGNQPKFEYPMYFEGGQYGTLFNSIIHTFKLGNAYLTNLVKCGLNNGHSYKGIEEYNWECIKTCFNSILLKELTVLKPKIVFAFGSKVETKFKYLIQENNSYSFIIVGLPHPAGRRRGFKDEYYRHLYFTRITEGLYKAGIYTLAEANKAFKLFLSHAP